MGFIKAIAMASGQFGESYREVIQYTNTDPSVLVKEVNTESGMIQDQSRLFVHPGQCAIYTDQGAIKDIITEPGMYYMDTSAPTLFQVDVLKGLGATVLESIKRIAYNGESILKQIVYAQKLEHLDKQNNYHHRHNPHYMNYKELQQKYK